MTDASLPSDGVAPRDGGVHDTSAAVDGGTGHTGGNADAGPPASGDADQGGPRGLPPGAPRDDETFIADWTAPVRATPRMEDTRRNEPRIEGVTAATTAPATSSSAAAPAPALVFDRVSVAYGRVPVLEDVHGSVAPGRTVALIGPNGAGKSTLIKAVLGLVPVARGRVTVLGRPPAQARREVAYVPQADTLDPDFPVSVAQVVLMGRYRRVGWVRRPGRADRDAAAAALDTVGLAHRARDRFGTLSGGQRQRVLLARAIASEPRLLLLDEPFNGVDVVSQDTLLAAIGTLRAGGAAVVISTHDLALAHLTCDDVCLLNRHQFGFGPPGDTLTPELLRAAYGGAAVELAGEAVIVARP